MAEGISGQGPVENNPRITYTIQFVCSCGGYSETFVSTDNSYEDAEAQGLTNAMNFHGYGFLYSSLSGEEPNCKKGTTRAGYQITLISQTPEVRKK